MTDLFATAADLRADLARYEAELAEAGQPRLFPPTEAEQERVERLRVIVLEIKFQLGRME